MVLWVFYHTLDRVGHGHRTLLGADLTHTRTQSETNSSFSAEEPKDGEISTDTRWRFSIINNQCKNWLEKTLQAGRHSADRDLLGEGEAFKSGTPRAELSLTFQSHQEKSWLAPCLSSSGWLKSYKPQCPEWWTANWLLGLLFFYFIWYRYIKYLSFIPWFVVCPSFPINAGRQLKPIIFASLGSFPLFAEQLNKG